MTDEQLKAAKKSIDGNIENYKAALKKSSNVNNQVIGQTCIIILDAISEAIQSALNISEERK